MILPSTLLAADRLALEGVFREETEEKQAAAEIKAAADRRLQHKRAAKHSLTIEETEALALFATAQPGEVVAAPEARVDGQDGQGLVRVWCASGARLVREPEPEQPEMIVSGEEKRMEKAKLNHVLDFHFGGARAPGVPGPSFDAGELQGWRGMPGLIH
jgi:hypothetical protein